MLGLFVEQHDPESPTSTKLRPLIILIHGGALSSRMYQDTIPIFKELGYRIFLVDLPGHGQSKSSGEFSFPLSTSLLHSTITDIRLQNPNYSVLIVGISLGGQAVLALLAEHPNDVDSAIVSGVSINPPDSRATFELPRMPTSERWIKIMTDDYQLLSPETLKSIQNESFAFSFLPSSTWPRTLVLVGDKDTAMAKRDFDELLSRLENLNPRCSGLVLTEAWHNHCIDIPERFTMVVHDFAGAL